MTRPRQLLVPGTEVACRPFLRWVGGKTRLLPELLRYVRAWRTGGYAGRYLEPFCGGAALFFAARPAAAILSDANRELVRAYHGVRDDVERVIVQLRQLEADHSAEHYARVREVDWRELCAVRSAARTIYLNKVCYNGLYRVNARGKFNVPLGRPSGKLRICDVDNLRACSLALRGGDVPASVQCADFREVLGQARGGDLVYADPPYLGDKSFTSYTSDKFGLVDHTVLAGLLGECARRGVSVVVTNSGEDRVRALYEGVGLVVREVADRRSVSCQAGGRATVTSFVASNLVPEDVS